MMLSIIFLTLLSCFSDHIFVLSQVQSKGRFQPYGFVKSGSFNDVIVEGPLLNNELLMKNALDRERPDPLTHLRPQAPHKFAEAVDVQIDITDPTRGTWIEDETNNHRTWRSIIKSPGALSISLLFNDFMLPEDGELYIIGKDETLGAFTAEVNNKDTRKFATTPVAGESVIIEYHEPMYNKKSSKPPALRIGKIVHGFRSTPFAYGASGLCHVDVECRKNSKTENGINSTVVIITDNGTSFCTGTMLNNVRQDGAQLVLTANHCIFSDPSFFVIGFNYQQPSCYKSRQEASAIPPKPQTAHGVTLVSRWEKSDFALLRIAERIPAEYNAYLAGWDATMHAPSEVYGVHHPLGDVKKISTFNGQTQLSAWTPWDKIKMHWRIPRWSEGATERGSSGSALFNSMSQVVGHLRGGSASCSQPDGWDMYGGLFADFHYPPEPIRLSRFLDPDNTGTRILNGVSLKDIHNRGVSHNINRPNHMVPHHVPHRMRKPDKPKLTNQSQQIRTSSHANRHSSSKPANRNISSTTPQIHIHNHNINDRRHRQVRKPSNQGFRMLHHN